MNRRIIPLMALALAAVLAAPASAEISMPSSVNGAGGARVSDANYILACTVGQPAVGSADNVSYDEYIGFWYPAYYQYAGLPEISAGVPSAFALQYAGPHPVDGAAALICAVPVGSSVSVRLYDVTGRVIHTLLEGFTPPGYHQLRLPATRLSGGVYFCRMEAARFTATRKLVLVR